jgi:hypothetical protein
MRINCPLNGDDDVCDQPMDVTLSAYHSGTRHEPGDGPSLISVEGFCRHAREFNLSDLADTDLDFLLEYAITEEYDRCHAARRSYREGEEDGDAERGRSGEGDT